MARRMNGPENRPLGQPKWTGEPSPGPPWAIHLCHLHSVPSGPVSVTHGCLLFARSSDQERNQEGGSHKAEKKDERAVKGVRPVIEPSCDDGRKGRKKCICRND